MKALIRFGIRGYQLVLRPCLKAVAGPNARKILSDAFGDAIDMSDENLPFMGVRTFEKSVAL